MASSLVSSMLPFLLIILLVFPNMDAALGAEMEGKLKETNHPDQVTVQKNAGHTLLDHARRFMDGGHAGHHLIDHYAPPHGHGR